MTSSPITPGLSTGSTSTLTTRFPALAASAWRRRLREFLYAVLGLPIGVASFSFAVSALSVSAALTVTVIGLPLLAGTAVASKWLGSRLREVANAMIGTNVPPPAQQFPAGSGTLGWLRSRVTDRAAWRAHLYLLLKLPVAVATFTAAVTLYASGLAGATYWMWRPFAGSDSGKSGTCHPYTTWNGHNVDTPLGIVVLSVVGVALLSVTPWLIRRLIALDTFLIRVLLGTGAR